MSLADFICSNSSRMFYFLFLSLDEIISKLPFILKFPVASNCSLESSEFLRASPRSSAGHEERAPARQALRPERLYVGFFHILGFLVYFHLKTVFLYKSQAFWSQEDEMGLDYVPMNLQEKDWFCSLLIFQLEFCDSNGF